MRRSVGPVLSGLLLAAALPAAAQDVTLRAGDPVSATVLGIRVEVPPRDRSRVDALYGGLAWTFDAPEDFGLVPQGALYLWRTPKDGSYLRASLLGLLDDVRYSRPLAGSLEAAFTFENTTPLWARADAVEGRTLSGEELRWSMVRAGAGLGVRAKVAPWQEDNLAEAALAYEAGGLFFRRDDETLASFREPSDVYEGRLHLRARWDAMERNLLERPHAGFAAGADALWAHRAGWRSWGGGPTGEHDAASARTWSAVTAWAVAALPVPFVRSSRHRVIAQIHAGAGARLDRFSALRLSGGSNAGDAESLAQPVLPAAAPDEISSRGYVVADAEYRFEAAFFLYLHLRATAARVDRERRAGDAIVRRTGDLNGVAAGVTSGFLWDTALEVFFSRNLDLESDGARGRSALWLSVAKSF